MFAHRTCALAVLGTALALSPGSARADDVRSLDEAAFLAELHARSPRLRAHAQRALAAHAAVDEAGVRLNPSIAWEREAVPAFGSHDDFLRLTVPVDLSGRRGPALAAARRDADAADADAARARTTLVVEARRAYARAAAARERVGLLDEARRRLATLVDALQTRAAQGDAAGYDAERIALELDLLDDELASARRALATARLTLGGLLGRAGQPVDAADPLTVAPVATPARPRRDDVTAARRRAEARDQEARAADRAWIPVLELGAGVLLSATADDTGVGYVVTIGGALPLLDRGGASRRRARAAARMWALEAEALASEAEADVAQARIALEGARAQALAFAAGPAPRAAALTRGATVAYQEGERSIVELLDALRAERAAEARALDLRLEARSAELDLALALGGAP